MSWNTPFRVSVVTETACVYGAVRRDCNSCLYSLLGAFGELRKVVMSFVVSVCSPARMEHLCYHWTDVHQI